MIANERSINQNKLELSFSLLQVISSQCALDTVVMATPLSGRLLCIRAPAMMESYYNFQPSGIGVMHSDVLLCLFLSFFSIITWIHLTSCSSQQTSQRQGQPCCPSPPMCCSLKRARVWEHGPPTDSSSGSLLKDLMSLFSGSF